MNQSSRSKCSLFWHWITNSLLWSLAKYFISMSDIVGLNWELLRSFMSIISRINIGSVDFTDGCIRLIMRTKVWVVLRYNGLILWLIMRLIMGLIKMMSLLNNSSILSHREDPDTLLWPHLVLMCILIGIHVCDFGSGLFLELRSIADNNMSLLILFRRVYVLLLSLNIWVPLLLGVVLVHSASHLSIIWSIRVSLLWLLVVPIGSHNFINNGLLVDIPLYFPRIKDPIILPMHVIISTLPVVLEVALWRFGIIIVIISILRLTLLIVCLVGLIV